MVHEPTAPTVTRFPETEQFPEAEKLTGSPEVADALTVKGAEPKTLFGRETKLIVCTSSETMLFMTTLSIETPHVCHGRTSAQVPIKSCANSNRSCIRLPASPGSFNRTWRRPLEKPDHADMSSK